MILKPPCGNYGDVNGDGAVTKADAELALDHWMGYIVLTEEALLRADVDGDGVVDWYDASLIYGFIQGGILTFPVCPLRVPPCGNYGDVNDDGYVTKEDSDMVSDYVVGNIPLTPEQKEHADVNADGIVDINDARIIGRYAAGQIDTFPVCYVADTLWINIAEMFYGYKDWWVLGVLFEFLGDLFVKINVPTSLTGLITLIESKVPKLPEWFPTSLQAFKDKIIDIIVSAFETILDRIFKEDD